MVNPIAIAVGRRIKDARVAVNMTQADLASRAGVTQGAISQVELGAHWPSLVLLIRTADPLSVAPSRLLGDTATPVRDETLEMVTRLAAHLGLDMNNETEASNA